MCTDRSAMIFLGAATEVGVLKRALAEAEEKAAKEKAAREKHEARLDEVQQELQDAISKCKALEHQVSDQKSELEKAHQSAQEALNEAQVPSRNSRRPKISRRVRHLVCKASM